MGKVEQSRGQEEGGSALSSGARSCNGCYLYFTTFVIFSLEFLEPKLSDLSTEKTRTRKTMMKLEMSGQVTLVGGGALQFDIEPLLELCCAAV